MRNGAILMAIVVLAFVGCESMPSFGRSAPAVPPDSDLLGPSGSTSTPAASGLAVSPEQRFKDVPLPAGLKEDPNRSFVYQDASLAIGRMVYTTKAGMNELANFYIQECPAADWELKHTIEVEGKELVFEKPGKRLVVTVKDLGMVRGRVLILTMTPAQ